MTYKASLGRVAAAAAGTMLGIVMAFAVPDQSVAGKVTTAAFLTVTGLAIAPTATLRITVADDAVSVRRFGKTHIFPAGRVAVGWTPLVAGFGRAGTSLTLRTRDGKSRITVPLALFPPRKIGELREHLEAVQGDHGSRATP